jgi:hypothetical protein
MPAAKRKRRNHSSEILGSRHQQNPAMEIEIIQLCFRSILHHYEVSELSGETRIEWDTFVSGVKFHEQKHKICIIH